MFKKVIVGLSVITLVAGCLFGSAAVASASTGTATFSLSQFVELLISIGVISPDKVALARSVAAGNGSATPAQTENSSAASSASLSVVLDRATITKSLTAINDGSSTTTVDAAFDLTLTARGGDVFIPDQDSSRLDGHTFNFDIYANGQLVPAATAHVVSWSVPSYGVVTAGLPEGFAFKIPEGGSVTIPVHFVFEGRGKDGIGLPAANYAVGLGEVDYFTSVVADPNSTGITGIASGDRSMSGLSSWRTAAVYLDDGATVSSSPATNSRLSLSLVSASIAKSVTQPYNGQSTTTVDATFDLSLTATGGNIYIPAQSFSQPFVFGTYLDGQLYSGAASGVTQWSVPSSGVVTTGLPQGMAFMIPQNTTVEMPVDYEFSGRNASGSAIPSGDYAVGLDAVTYAISPASALLTQSGTAGLLGWRTTTVNVSDTSSNQIPSAPTTTCTDSDGGINLNVAGTADGRVNGIGTYFTDESVSVNGGACSGTSCTGVAEGYCQNGQVMNHVYQCSTGYSVNGACATSPNPPKTTVIYPTAGTVLNPGQVVTVRYSTTGFPPGTKIEAQLDKGANYSARDFMPVGVITSGYQPATGSFNWTVPSVPTGSDYSILISNDWPNTEISPFSSSGYSGNFTIAAPQASAVTAPTSPTAITAPTLSTTSWYADDPSTWPTISTPSTLSSTEAMRVKGPNGDQYFDKALGVNSGKLTSSPPAGTTQLILYVYDFGSGSYAVNDQVVNVTITNKPISMAPSSSNVAMVSAGVDQLVNLFRALVK